MMGQSSVKGKLGKGEEGAQEFPSLTTFSEKKKPKNKTQYNRKVPQTSFFLEWDDAILNLG